MIDPTAALQAGWLASRGINFSIEAVTNSKKMVTDMQIRDAALDVQALLQQVSLSFDALQSLQSSCLCPGILHVCIPALQYTII